jgi:uncharacterized protein (TIGR02996 family)
MHTADDFLRAIEAEPGDRTRRLVFADWLDERADPRGELIRIEEEMRTLPVFSDRFWELKPRRNELRAAAGPEWCGRMRYGTECEPVFRHGIPDGWRERWRLIREFTERWRRIPMPDVGGRQEEIAEAEAGLGRKLPPPLREWAAFMLDHGFDPFADLRDISGQPLLGLVSRMLGGYYWSVPYSELESPDPLVRHYTVASDGTYPVFPYELDLDVPALPFTEFGLRYAFERSNSLIEGHYATISMTDSFIEEVGANLPNHARCGSLEIHESDNLLVAFGTRDGEPRRNVWVRIRQPLTRRTVAPFIQSFMNRPPAAAPPDDEPTPF